MMTKLQAYKGGYYRCPCPPVNWDLWTDKDWIRYIDTCGQWTIEIKEDEKKIGAVVYAAGF